jgi:phosphoglycerate dehydrogenase-like enzyme
VAFDPFLTAVQAAAAGVELVDLDALLHMADFVSINCPLTPETRHLINAERLALMRPSAFLINTARGPIVDQQALTAALTAHRLAGAALDVFEDEPIHPDDPLLRLDNVIVTPHAICWTDECFRGMGHSACRSILDIATGQMPAFVVNREVEHNSRLRERLAAASGRMAARP